MNIINILKDFISKCKIKWKIMGIVFLVTVILGSWASWQVYNASMESVRTYLERTGVSISKNVATRSEDYVFTNDMYRLHNLMEETLENNPDVRYLFVEGADGEILVSSFGEGIPRGLREVNSANPDDDYNTKKIMTEEGVIYDIATPIFDGRSGAVRLGVTESGVRAMTGEMIVDILILTAIISVVGLIVSYYLSSFIVKPVTELAETSKKIGKGDFEKKPIQVKTQDEIGELSESFNLMIEGLQDLDEKNENYRKELEAKEKMRLKLLKKIITSQENERERIARELHDEAGQSLTSLKIALKRIEDSRDLDEAKMIIGDLRNLLDNTIDELKMISKNLRPRVLDDLGLFTALEKYLREYEKNTGIKVNFEIYNLDNWSPSPIFATTIYRIVQEASTNVLKHAGAKNLWVEINKVNEDEAEVVIKDDGIGFNIDKHFDDSSDDNLGLFGMEERASIIKGTLNIYSKENKGTTVSMRFPIEEVHDAKIG